MKGNKGSVAVFLTAILMSFLLIIGVLSEAAAGKAARSYGDAVLGQAGRSVLSEYDRELQEAYGIFGLRLSSEEIEERLSYYAEQSFGLQGEGLLCLKMAGVQADLTEYSLLNLQLFKAQVLEYMKFRAPGDLPFADGLVSAGSALFGLSDYEQKAEEATEEFKQAEKARKRAERRLENATEENAEERAAELEAAETTYQQALEQGRRQAENVRDEAGSMETELRESESILELLAGYGAEDHLPPENREGAAGPEGAEGTPKGSRVLRNQGIIQGLPSRVMEAQSGIAAVFNGMDSDFPSAAELRDSVYVNLYLMEKCHHHLSPGSQDDSFFANELEYILWGELSDEKNYTKTRNCLLTLRTGLNLVHIYSSAEKTELLAAAAATLLPGPGAPLMQFLLATAWAAGEASLDIVCLEKGNGVPLWKTDGDWQLSLENLMAGKIAEVGAGLVEEGVEGAGADLPAEGIQTPEAATGKVKAEGLDYQAYLLLLLFMEPEEQKLFRLLDLIQLNLKGRYDDSFSMGQCSGGFGFQAELQRQRSFLNVAGLRRSVYQEVHLY